MHTFAVIGFFEDTHQRFSTTVEADSAQEAEDDTEAAYPGLIVCGVIAGDHPAADTGRTSIDE